jgi:teichuronic acid biosynthesis glycosyltransferase TuaC
VNVLFVTNMWPEEERPWYGSFVASQARALRAAGVEVDVLAIRGFAGRAAYATRMAQMLGSNRRRRWDLVHAHYGHSGVVARMHFRAPLVVSYCGDDLLGTRRPDGGITVRSRAEVAVFRELARVARATITKSSAMEDALPASRRDRNHVIPNGVDLDRFRRLPRDDARAELGWGVDERVVLFAGNPEVATKNFPRACEVVDRVAADLPGARLRVAWGHPPEAMPRLYSAADALLLTSQSEGSPNVVKEAMACELPVVSTCVGDVADRVRGLPACHAGEADTRELASALRRALDHGPVREARAAAAEVSDERVAARVVGVYETALRAGRTAPATIGEAT